MPIIGALEPETVASNFVNRMVRAAVGKGARQPQLLAAIGVSGAQLRNPIGRLAGIVFVDLFSAIEREFADPAMSLKLAGGARPTCFSDLGFISMFEPTVGDMLSATVNIQGFRQNVWHVIFDQQSDPARLSWHFQNSCEDLFAAVVEFAVASYVHLYRNSVPASPVPRAVYFKHRPRFAREIYVEILGCPVSFESASTWIEFDQKQLNLPSPSSNPELQRELLACYGQAMTWLAAGKTHSAFAYMYLASELNKSTLKLDAMAKSFGISERTLRRRLVEEGHPFRELLKKVRRDLCDLYRLENRRSMSDIAELLGYAELSAFTRAHRQWYGKPPTGY